MSAKNEVKTSNQKGDKVKLTYTSKADVYSDINGESSEEEENAIIEIDQISFLGSSKTSLKRQPTKRVKDSTGKELYKSAEKLIIDDYPKVPVNEKTKKFKPFYNYRGIILALFSAFLTSIVVITIKKAFLYTPSEQMVLRNIVQVIVMFIIGKYQKQNLLGPRKYRKLLWLRGLINTITMTCAYFAISFVNPSDQTAIVQSSIIVTAIFGNYYSNYSIENKKLYLLKILFSGRIFLKEKLSIVHVFAVGLTVSGVILISQPTFLFSGKKAVHYEETKNLSTILSGFNCTMPDLSKECDEIVTKFNEKTSDMINSNNLYLLGK